MSSTMSYPDALSMEDYIGSVVRNPHGEELGTIEEMISDPVTGYVTSLILSTSGFLGIRKKIAIPWDMVTLDDGDGALLVNVDKGFLKRLPPYQGNQ